MTAGELGVAACFGVGVGFAVAGAAFPASIVCVVAGVVSAGVASAHPELGLFGAPVCRVRSGIALTIDDGPDPETTPLLLAALANAGKHATFFLLADRAARHPELVRAVVAAGHEVGLHGLTHSAKLTWAAPSTGAIWLREGIATLQAAGAPSPRWFRPPFGVVSPRLFAAARLASLEVAWVSVRPGDGVAISPARLRRRLLAARSGDVVLIHEGNPVTCAVLPEVLAAWRPIGVGSLAELV